MLFGTLWRRCQAPLQAGAVCVVMLGIMALTLDPGLRIRRWAWESTKEVHFRKSLDNAIEWGMMANQFAPDEVHWPQGLVKLYKHLVETHGPEGEFSAPGTEFGLDYAPLRLLIASRWAAWATAKYSSPGDKTICWRNTYEFNRPMLNLNTGCEIAAAIAMFLLVRYWIRRCDLPPPPWRWRLPWMKPHVDGIHAGQMATAKTLPAFRGAWAGLGAALLLWFNPAVIWDAHCFPQWDVWLLPFFILAVYLALRNWWLPAAFLVGFESMAKGQILMVAPIILLWPLFNRRYSALLRAAVGFVAGLAVAVSPWLVINDQAKFWVKHLIMAAGLGVPIFLIPRRTWLASLLRHTFGLAALAALLLPLHRYMGFSKAELERVAMVGIAAVIAAHYLPWRALPTWFVAIAAAALCACVLYWDGSMAWYTVGIVYPTRHWKRLAWCKAANLGAILQDNPYNWQFHGPGSEFNLDDFLPWPHVTATGQVHLFHIVLACCVALIAISILWRGRTGWVYRTLTAGITAGLVAVLFFRLRHWDWAQLHHYLPWPKEHVVVEVRSAMIALYAISLTFCSFALARHARWYSRRFFFALVAPWVLMFALLPQMLDRYLVWGSAVSTAIAVISIEGLLLHVIMTIITVLMMANWMFTFGEARLSNTAIPWIPFLTRMHPDIGWAVLGLAAVCFYSAMRPGERQPLASN